MIVKGPGELDVGDVVDGFRVEGFLHRGGMADIWKVTREATSETFALKVPQLRGGEGTTTIVSFETERMILPRLTGRHVPRFVAAGDFDLPYVVMEYVQGPSLKPELERLPLPLSRVTQLGVEIARALHDLHEQLVIHHDIKPSNIMLRETGEAVLVDFGFARHLELPDLIAEEIPGPVGTGPYISPEQLARDRTDPRSDIYALGVMLYFFATGERPFGDPKSLREWRRRLWRDPLPPRARNPDLPPWLQEVILGCLETDPDARPQSAAQVAFELRHPEQVRLTERATRMHGASATAVLRRWLRAKNDADAHPHAPPRPVTRAPIVMACVDLSSDDAHLKALQVSVQRALQTEPGARLACVNVLKLSRLSIDEETDAEGNNIFLQRLAELKHWTGQLAFPQDRVTHHVLQGTDAATALLDYAKLNKVDQIVMAARGHQALRRYLGSVSSKVVAEAPCTVTVVKTRSKEEAEQAP